MTNSTIDRAAVVRLNRSGELVRRKAERAGVTIESLGTALLFDRPRAYSGASSDWVLLPADQDPAVAAGMGIPRDQRDRLLLLATAGVNFPAIYIAHEVPKGVIPGLEGVQPHLENGEPVTPMSRFHEIASEEIERAVEIPPPEQTVALTTSLGEAASLVGRTMLRLAPVVGSLAIAPLLAVGALTSPLAGLDPVVFGAWTGGPGPGSGTPAVWFALAQWRW